VRLVSGIRHRLRTVLSPRCPVTNRARQPERVFRESSARKSPGPFRPLAGSLRRSTAPFSTTAGYRCHNSTAPRPLQKLSTRDGIVRVFVVISYVTGLLIDGIILNDVPCSSSYHSDRRRTGGVDRTRRATAHGADVPEGGQAVDNRHRGTLSARRRRVAARRRERHLFEAETTDSHGPFQTCGARRGSDGDGWLYRRLRRRDGERDAGIRVGDGTSNGDTDDGRTGDRDGGRGVGPAPLATRDATRRARRRLARARRRTGPNGGGSRPGRDSPRRRSPATSRSSASEGRRTPSTGRRRGTGANEVP